LILEAPEYVASYAPWYLRDWMFSTILVSRSRWISGVNGKSNSLGLDNFVPYFAWAGAEIAVALVCISIPALRPLYLKTRGLRSAIEISSEVNQSEVPRFSMCAKQDRQIMLVPDSAITHSQTEIQSYHSDDRDIEVQHGKHSSIIVVKTEFYMQEHAVDWPLKT
jgi:hypothetical protein